MRHRPKRKKLAKHAVGGEGAGRHAVGGGHAGGGELVGDKWKSAGSMLLGMVAGMTAGADGKIAGVESGTAGGQTAGVVGASAFF